MVIGEVRPMRQETKNEGLTTMERQLKKAILKVIDLKIWESIGKVIDSKKFTIFWASLLLISAVLGVVLNFIS